MHNVVKWSNILYTARFLRYVWPFYYNSTHEKSNEQIVKQEYVKQIVTHITGKLICQGLTGLVFHLFYF